MRQPGWRPASIGFNAEIADQKHMDMWGALLQQVMPEDLIKFGLIPEFVGRVPVMVSLDLLDRGRPGADPDRAEERH